MKASRKNGDVWLIAGVVAVALLLFAVLWLLAERGTAVAVTVDGKPYATYPLSQNTEVKIAGVDGGSCTLVIADGQATVVAATCPDGICVRHRAVSRGGETIVCLPNRVVVTVVGAPAVDGEV
ncbi:MAG: NusG domain II-containing protein [Clostridia bacterium]|nr:NusG domain II-containing protein [Clostridia bacterium]